MAWETFSLHFKQIFDGGYRYLDRCGEFMLAAESAFGLLSEDPTPSNAKMSIPELGISVLVSTRELAVSQEFSNKDDRQFLSLCKGLSSLYSETFTPRAVESNGFASKSMWGFNTADQAAASSLKMGDEFHGEMAVLLEMPAKQKHLDFNFSAGSCDLHVLIHPVTFQNINLQKQNAAPRLTASQRTRIERQNKKMGRVNFNLSHAIMLEVDLIELEPPVDSLDKHFSDLEKKERLLRERFRPG